MKRHPALIPLSHQHHDALALCVFIDRGLKKEPTAANARKLRGRAAQIYELLLAGHFEVEETVLFPAVRRHLPHPALADELTAEHRSLRRCFENLAGLDGGGLIDALRCLGGDLDRHIRKEERVLFQAVQEALDEPAFEALGKALADALQDVCLAPAMRSD